MRLIIDNMFLMDSLGSLQGVRILWAEKNETLTLGQFNHSLERVVLPKKLRELILGEKLELKVANAVIFSCRGCVSFVKNPTFCWPWYFGDQWVEASLRTTPNTHWRFSEQLSQKTVLHDAAANVHGNLRVPPPTVTLPENKSLFWDYWGIMVVNK